MKYMCGWCNKQIDYDDNNHTINISDKVTTIVHTDNLDEQNRTDEDREI